MNKEDLVKEVAKKTKLSQKDVAEVLNATIEAITKTVSKGKKVTLVGFGSFESRKRAARLGRNPQTGESITISSRNVITFNPSIALKNKINKKA